MSHITQDAKMTLLKKFHLTLCFFAMTIVIMLLWPPCSGALGPKYLFLFVGDGMGISQRVAAGQFAGKPLLMDTFPSHGLTSTHAANRFITGSAAAATALACGEKTNVGVLGLDSNLKPLKTIAEMARDRGMKVGIVTTVSLDNATPAGFYAHVASRNSYYDIALALARSDFHYFAGGGLMNAGLNMFGYL
jgi:alkaline phosphatase